MHPLTILIASTFSGLALAAACTGDKSIAGYCTTLTLLDRTNPSVSPSTSQCQDTCAAVLQDPSDWNVDFAGKPDGYRQPMLGHDCGFSVSRGDGEPANLRFSMRNQDILDIIDEAVNRFGGANGRVGAEGTMNCEGHIAKWYID
ncbi:hypothetical protein F5X99DRAFT_170734 [Biscogniauxia marginata]|nr:hypothetical protein F5X99DRAFT_170734 [Biscogniauxia marginata]